MEIEPKIDTYSYILVYWHGSYGGQEGLWAQPQSRQHQHAEQNKNSLMNKSENGKRAWSIDGFFFVWIQMYVYVSKRVLAWIQSQTDRYIDICIRFQRNGIDWSIDISIYICSLFMHTDRLPSAHIYIYVEYWSKCVLASRCCPLGTRGYCIYSRLYIHAYIHINVLVKQYIYIYIYLYPYTFALI